MSIAAEGVVPAAREVLRALGRPAGAAVDERLARLLAEARALFVELARPAGLWREVTPAAFAGIHRGAGENEPATPLDAIFPRAQRLALFAATVGEAVSVRIGELFQATEFPLGAVLDATASCGAERAADAVQEWWAAVLARGGRGPGRQARSDQVPGGHAPGERARSGAAPASGLCLLRYSPGYCGWNVSGQRALFHALEPERIGITLNESCLMRPIKSVSGVIVAGAPEIHAFENRFPFCGRCREWACRERLKGLGALPSDDPDSGGGGAADDPART